MLVVIINTIMQNIMISDLYIYIFFNQSLMLFKTQHLRELFLSFRFN